MTSTYLLDTSVISLLAPDKPPHAKEFAIWLREHESAVYVSAITVAEIEQGVRKLYRAGGVERAERLSAWLDGLLRSFDDRVLCVDALVARIAGAMSDAALASGRHPGLADVLIAATAGAHKSLLLTSNGRHFSALGIDFVDPLVKLPA